MEEPMINANRIPAQDLERLHWNQGGWEAWLGYRHRPSGTVVKRRCIPGMPLAAIDRELMSELAEKMRSEDLPEQ
jgi:hypothetical protein